MEWARILTHITGTVDQKLLLRNEDLVAENQILRAWLQGLKGEQKVSPTGVGHSLRHCLLEATTDLGETVTLQAELLPISTGGRYSPLKT